MKKTSISDEKRLVRGKHYELARYALRARDAVHSACWKFLTIAGPSPNEEITCIRELFRDAIITSVDNEEANVLAAINAGTDDPLQCNLFNFQPVPKGALNQVDLRPPQQLDRIFDVICLDLTGHASKALHDLIKIYWNVLSPRGVMIITFSYGRDVVEAYQYDWRCALAKYGQEKTWSTAHTRGIEQLKELIIKHSLSESVAQRIYYALGIRCEFLWSVLQYSGAAMPMVSCLLQKNGKFLTPRFLKISEMDFLLAVTAENLGNIFACPQDRILELRRSLAGTKAATTRALRTAGNGHAEPEQKLLEFHLEPTEDHGSTTRQVWSEEDLAKLRRDYPNFDCNAAELAKQMGRTTGALRQKAFSLGIYRRGPHGGGQ
jgi:hypothetical protein